MSKEESTLNQLEAKVRDLLKPVLGPATIVHDDTITVRVVEHAAPEITGFARKRLEVFISSTWKPTRP